jgi:prophage antirepressor-like protein
MDYISFMDHNFTLLQDPDGEPWLVGKELCDYLERCRDTLLRQEG